MKRDWPLWFFALAALCSLAVSLPATSAAMQLTHGWGWWVAAVAVFEVGAVGLELMTLAVPQWRGRLHAWVAPTLTEQAVALLNLRQSAEVFETVTMSDDPLDKVVEIRPWGWKYRAVRVQLCRRDLMAEGDLTRENRAGQVTVQYAVYPAPVAQAREFAAAILRACDEAERLEAEYRAEQSAVKEV